MPDEFMSCTVEPELTIEPGSISGPGGSVDITLSATTRNCNKLTVEYEIHGSANYEIVEAKASPKYRLVASGGRVAARKSFPKPGGKRKFAQRVWIDRRAGGTDEAALRVVATAWGVGQGQLAPVHSLGRIAVLSGGLRQLAGVALSADLDFDKAMELVKKLKPKLIGDHPQLGGLDWPGFDTLARAVQGDTASLRETNDKMGPAIQLLKKDVTTGMPPKFIGKLKASFANAAEAAASLPG